MKKDEKRFISYLFNLVDWETIVYVQPNASKRNEDTTLAGWLIKFTEETSIVGQYVSTIDIESSWHEKLNVKAFQAEERASAKPQR